jgi:hypothetical protein
MSIFGNHFANMPTPSKYEPSEQDRAMFAKKRRNRIAEGFAFALVAQHGYDSWFVDDLAKYAVDLTDSLIAELDK